jgi:uncharacterized tellurite resistance protein B-like protein
MGISDLYMGIGQKRNISHFANIVRIAKSDNQISPEEIAFLTKVSKKYNITEENFKEILKSPESVPTIAHINCIERIERLYELLIMIRADHNIQTEEVSVLRKIVIGLAFPLHEVDRIVDEAITINTDSTDVESFTKAMLKLMHLK